MASYDDLPGLMEMWVESVDEIRAVDAIAAQVDLSKDMERRHFFRMVMSEEDSGVTVVEMPDGELAGMLTFQEFVNPPFFKIIQLALISSVHVRPAYRRLGLAKKMVDWTVEWLRGRGVQEVQLANSPWNQAADATWERLDFEIITVTRRRLLTP